MPEGRILLKRISQSKKLPNLKTDGARLLYSWLNSHLDINGCFSGDAHIINSMVFTRLRRSVETIEEYLQDLESQKLILRYEANGDLFLIYPDFTEKQPKLRPDHEAKGTILLPTKEQLEAYYNQTPTQLQPKDDQTTSFVRTSKVKESKVNIYSSSFNKIFWPEWPNRVSRKQAEKAWSKLDLSDDSINEIMTGLRNQIKEHKRRLDNGVWCPNWPNPATWINGERWKDEVEEGQAQGIEENTAVEEAREDVSHRDLGKARTKIAELAIGATKRI